LPRLPQRSGLRCCAWNSTRRRSASCAIPPRCCQVYGRVAPGMGCECRQRECSALLAGLCEVRRYPESSRIFPDGERARKRIEWPGSPRRRWRVSPQMQVAAGTVEVVAGPAAPSRPFIRDPSSRRFPLRGIAQRRFRWIRCRNSGPPPAASAPRSTKRDGVGGGGRQVSGKQSGLPSLPPNALRPLTMLRKLPQSTTGRDPQS
jgi:hypothetical protein